MNIVNPDKRTTLLLNADYIPLFVTTARAAIRHVIKGVVKPIDRFGNPHFYAEDERGKPVNDLSQHYWFMSKDEHFNKFDKNGFLVPYEEKNGIYYSDQPVIRSSNSFWPVPTVCLTTTRFFRRHNVKKPTVHRLARLHKNVCQICLQEFKTSELTIEHVYPKEKCGANDETNFLPTCGPCNSRKANTYPYYDVNGVLLDTKIKKIPTFLTVSAKEHRPEWEQYGVFVE